MYFTKTIRYIVEHMYVMYVNLECVSSLTSIWWISIDDSNIYFEILKAGIFMRWSMWFPGYIFKYLITAIICLHGIRFFFKS